MQNQANPNKSKQKGLHFLGFLLAESGLFNGLQRIQIKKSFPFRFRHPPSRTRARAAPSYSGTIAQFLLLAKEIQNLLTGRWFFEISAELQRRPGSCRGIEWASRRSLADSREGRLRRVTVTHSMIDCGADDFG
jgi:hypothetical protein